MAALRHILFVVLCGGIGAALVPAVATAQEQPRPLLWDLARSVVLDPTTYAPATVVYAAKRQDWTSSQVLFEHGWLEGNERFTISGRPNDLPLSYASGLSQIRRDALGQLQWSVTHNLANRVCERILIRQFPAHRKLLRRLSWIERISMASYVTYLGSAEHFRQARRNHDLVRIYGY